ncbi:MAG: hypothetical protein QOG46_2396, partial [Pseudonocardiales bacterium]|nr:hypothetical protein [Pseudonocardiales bacterium]
MEIISYSRAGARPAATPRPTGERDRVAWV